MLAKAALGQEMINDGFLLLDEVREALFLKTASNPSWKNPESPLKESRPRRH
jgi:hypothetical protein